MRERKDVPVSPEAMVVPKGAKISVPPGVEIGFDVQGDLVLQESQAGFSQIASHYGSILIDEGVSVVSRNIRALKMIRVKGAVETANIMAEKLAVEEGEVKTRSIKAREISIKGGLLESRAIETGELVIDGTNVEIGTISAERMVLKNGVKGTIIISQARERSIDERCQIKGGFESDIELLGYLAKYRREILNERVLSQLSELLKGESRYLLEELAGKEEKPVEEPRRVAPEVEDEFGITEKVAGITMVPEIEVEEKGEVDEEFDAAHPELKRARRLLEFEHGSKESPTPIIKVVLQYLRRNDIISLQGIFSKWKKVIEKAEVGFTPTTKEAFDLIRYSLGIIPPR
jgi:hypothetical protein